MLSRSIASSWWGIGESSLGMKSIKKQQWQGAATSTMAHRATAPPSLLSSPVKSRRQTSGVFEKVAVAYDDASVVSSTLDGWLMADTVVQLRAIIDDSVMVRGQAMATGPPMTETIEGGGTVARLGMFLLWLWWGKLEHSVGRLECGNYI
ncbi:putative conserved oligomeric Golgi complex subunit 1 [Sesbania bispinosa]|nr:putative conserved oligomeric Golgi complex subunit 1 [Sesbania bispinosa]